MKSRILSIFIILLSASFFYFFSINSVSARIGIPTEWMCKITGEITKIFQVDWTNEEYRLEGYADKYVGLKIKILDKKSYNNENSKEACDYYELNSIIGCSDESWESADTYSLSIGDVIEANIYYGETNNIKKIENYNQRNIKNYLLYIGTGLLIIVLAILLIILKKKKKAISSNTPNPPTPPHQIS